MNGHPGIKIGKCRLMKGRRSSTIKMKARWVNWKSTPKIYRLGKNRLKKIKTVIVLNELYSFNSFLYSFKPLQLSQNKVFFLTRSKIGSGKLIGKPYTFSPFGVS